jgi:hypothetical protein
MQLNRVPTAVSFPAKSFRAVAGALFALCAAAPALGVGDLVPTSVSGPATANEGTTITVSWTVTNSGDAPISGAWSDKLLLSDDASVGNDRLLANITVTATLAPGQSYTRSTPITLPQGAVGLQRLIVQSDSANFVPEANESNNTLVDPTGITIAAQFADLVVGLVSGPASANSGESVTVQYSITNQGAAATSQYRYDQIVFDPDGIPGNGDDLEIRGPFYADGSFAPGESRTYSVALPIPSYTPMSGKWQVRTDVYGSINEGPSGESNNIADGGSASIAPPDVPLIACPQTLFKFHPEMDDLLAGIFTRLPKARLLLATGDNPASVEQLTARWKARGDGIDKVAVFVPPLDRDHFLLMLKLSEVILDTIHFNGMNSSLEGFAMGTPIVTLPKAFQRGRHTQAMYRRMGYTELIAADETDYVRLVVRLATDTAFRARASQTILERCGVLFADQAVVRGFEDVLRTAFAQRTATPDVLSS